MADTAYNIVMWHKAEMGYGEDRAYKLLITKIDEALTQARREEREACAQVAEAQGAGDDEGYLRAIGNVVRAIRAREQDNG